MHCKFTSIIPHKDKTTKFLALDKCLPKRKFLQLLDIETKNDSPSMTASLSYDEEWLTILNLTNHLINAKNTVSYMPGSGSPYRWNFTPTDIEKQNIRTKITDLRIPQNFCRTAEIHKEHQPFSQAIQPKAYINPQTKILCENLQIDDPLNLTIIMNGHELNQSDNFSDILISSSRLDDENISIISNSPINKNLSRSLLNLPPPKVSAIISNPEEVCLDIDENEEVILSKYTSINTSSVHDELVNVENATNVMSDNFENSINNPTLDLQETSIGVKKFKRRNTKNDMSNNV